MSNTTTLKRKVAKKVLVVEDEGEMGLLLNLILCERNFELDYVNNLLSAEEYLQKQHPSVIILDNKLPDGFGVDFINYLNNGLNELTGLIHFLRHYQAGLYKDVTITFLKDASIDDVL